MAAAAAQRPAELQFLVSTGVEKPNENLRKFIRSHVMLGKNKGKKRPIGKKTKDTTNHESSSKSEGPRTARSGTLVPDVVLQQHLIPSTTDSRQLTVPAKFGWDLAPITFPDAVEAGTVDIFLKFSSIAKQLLFPLESCVFFENKAKSWIAPLTFDAVFMHTMIFMSRSYFDFHISGRSTAISKGILHHFTRALRLLRERLSGSDDQAMLSDSNMAAIMALSSHALLIGDVKSAKNHLEGLHKIVCIRGGLSSFLLNPKLLIDIMRCDIGMVLHHGFDPIFSKDNEFLMQYPNLTQLLELHEPSNSALQRENDELLDGLDTELCHAWGAISEFCSVINFVAGSKQYISLNIYLETMASVMYRLLSMSFDSGSVNEAVRLGLLAFASSVFLQWKSLGLSYAHLTHEFKSCLVRLALSQPPSRLYLWLLMVGTVSVLNPVDNAWLKPLLAANLASLELTSWQEMQPMLSSLLWINKIHDSPARTVFDSIIFYSGSASIQKQDVPVDIEYQSF
ncbi:hypothetical protein BT63DRAFT_457382 [Microthyrium microscopicum]|uniref:Uncharacterized protein n=1 Tax=Microthyrium microscopicum TaxID=703497 RepID=A0A6A6U7G0_9PEZI|nr:hypothetical protein BT63DRAFT_457382 [Microthyrium microscopicum]